MDKIEELRNLKADYREGGNLKEEWLVCIILQNKHRVTEHFTNSLTTLMAKIDKLAQKFLNGTVDHQAYTLEWDQLVRDAMKVIDQVEQALSREE